MAIGKLRVASGDHSHSLGNRKSRVALVESVYQGLVESVYQTLDLLVARAIAVMVFPHSASPQHLADRSLIRILGNVNGTIVETCF